MCVNLHPSPVNRIWKNCFDNGWTCQAIYRDDGCHQPAPGQKIVGGNFYVGEKYYKKLLEDVNDNLIRETGKPYKVFKNLDEFDIYIFEE